MSICFLSALLLKEFAGRGVFTVREGASLKIMQSRSPLFAEVTAEASLGLLACEVKYERTQWLVKILRRHWELWVKTP